MESGSQDKLREEMKKSPTVGSERWAGETRILITVAANLKSNIEL